MSQFGSRDSKMVDGIIQTLGLSQEQQDSLAIVRVSESCELRAHKWVQIRNTDSMENVGRIEELLNNPVSQEANTIAHNRLRLGNVLEPLVVDIVSRQEQLMVVDRQLCVWYYYPEWNALMVGHIDGIAHREDNLKCMLLEIKTTSESNFFEVVNAIESYDGESEMYTKYKEQMRRYAALLYNTKKPYKYADAFFNPMFGNLTLMNRNSGEVYSAVIPLFGEEEDIGEEFLQSEIRRAFGFRHPIRQQMHKRPKDKFSSHPVCTTCYFRNECYIKATKEENIEDAEKDFILSYYADADRFIKTGNSMKARVKSKVTDLMDSHNINKIELLDGSSVTRYSTQSKHGKVDYEQMKKDEVYDKYVGEGKPYDVVRFNLKR